MDVFCSTGILNTKTECLLVINIIVEHDISITIKLPHNTNNVELVIN